MKKDSIVITGGGTGGHLKVADAFIEEFHNRGIDIIFIGSSNGQDRNWFENDKRLKEAVFLDTYGVVNKNFFGKIKSLLNILKKVKQCLNIFSKYNVKNVVSVGGFSAASATFASILSFKTKLYIHEQNSRMGKLNKITSRFAEEVFSSYIADSKVKHYPVSQIFFEKKRLRTKLEYIAFFGGSQGAVAINDFALKIATKLDKMNIKIIHQTGKRDFDRVKKVYEEMNLDVDVFDFSKDIPSKMKKADLAVSRAGASTLWEMTANCLPSLYIPYKYAESNHQYYNAKDLVDEKKAFLCNEDDLSEDRFFEILKSCDIEEISSSLENAIKPNAIGSMVDIILKK